MKTVVFQAICDALRAQFDAFRTLSRQTRSGSGDEETRSEGKYDTRSTEANYLADGQARQAQVAAEALLSFEALGPRLPPPGGVVEAGALVRLEFPGESAWFFLGPAAGGLEVTAGAESVTVITPESPLGRQLSGRVVGDRLPGQQAIVREVL